MLEKYCPSVLYIGPRDGTSGHRARALERLGYQVFLVNPRDMVSKNRVLTYWDFHTGYTIAEKVVRRRLLQNLDGQHFDFVFVGTGEAIGPDLLRELKRRYHFVISYNIDDPYGGRDGRRWRVFLKSLPLYDLVVTLRECNVQEALDAGAKQVMRVTMSADEVAHRPQPLSQEDLNKWSSEVAFIGTWMPERGPLLAKLIKLGVPLSIFGNRWQRAKEWPVLRPFWRSAGLNPTHEYPKAVQAAKICLGLLSKGNRDLSTTRSFEIPYLQCVLCAERTTEHVSLYADGEEAVFWSTPEECAEKCLALLENDERRKRIALNGRARCLRNGTTNEFVLAEIMRKAGYFAPVGR